jgi:quercetin dioxygenase-like cupin family protein
MAASQAIRYRWQDLPHDHPMEKIDRRRIIGEKMMLSEVFLHKGFHVSTHSHQNEQFAVVLSGEVRFGIGAKGSAERYEIVLKGGEVLHLPANVPHSAQALADSRLIDLFSPPSETTGVDRTEYNGSSRPLDQGFTYATSIWFYVSRFRPHHRRLANAKRIGTGR